MVDLRGKGGDYISWSALPHFDDLVGDDPSRRLPDEFEGTPRDWADYMGLSVEEVCMELAGTMEIADRTRWNVSLSPTRDKILDNMAKRSIKKYPPGTESFGAIFKSAFK